MEQNGIELDNHIIRFFFDNFYKKNINYWTIHVENLDERDLLSLKNKFTIYKSKLPSELEINLYSTISEYNIKGLGQPVYVPNGDQGIISLSYNVGNEILKLIEEKLKIIQGEQLKEFPDFGSWDSVDNRSHFLLKSNVLGCVALAFDKVKDLQALQLENIYVRLSMILYQYNGKPYSHISFRNAKQKSKKTPEQCRKEVSFSVSESVEFITYLLKMEEKLNSVKKNRHQS